MCAYDYLQFTPLMCVNENKQQSALFLRWNSLLFYWYAVFPESEYQFGSLRCLEKGALVLPFTKGRISPPSTPYPYYTLKLIV